MTAKFKNALLELTHARARVRVHCITHNFKDLNLDHNLNLLFPKLFKDVLVAKKKIDGDIEIVSMLTGLIRAKLSERMREKKD